MPFFAQGVFVKIEGYEFAKFQQVHEHPPDEQGHRKREVHVREDRHEFFCEKINVFPHAGQVLPGVTQFQFSYVLPPNLPGTFYEQGGNWDHHHATGYLGEIIYYIQAKVDVHGMSDCKEEVKFIINERQDRALEPSFSQNSKTFAFVKGSLTCKVWLDSHSYFPGNTVLAKLEANNTAVKNTPAVFVKVYRHTNLKAHHHHKSVSTKVYEHRYPGFEPSFYGVRFLPFQIPINLPPSSKLSSRVNSKYDFVVECEISGAFNLVTHLDCTIIAPQFMFAQAQPALPALATVPNEVNFRPPWQPDSARGNCSKCAAEFGLFNRRHHCRHCGLLMCKSCVPEMLKIPNLGYEEAVLICIDCLPVVKEKGGKHFQDAPAFIPHSNVEPEWNRPPPSAPSLASGASAPPAMSPDQMKY